MSDEYLSKGMDLKRLLLYFQKKIWLVIMLAILGGTLGGVIYQVVKAVKMPIEYETVSKLYISFGHDENGEVYQHYNGYTWNDLMGTDPILDTIMLNLPGYEKNKVRDAITAEILSDIRLLTITVRGDTEKFVREIRDAVEIGLGEYAQDSEELNQIKTIRSGAPERVFWDDRTTQACVAGVLVFTILSFITLLFVYIFDESVYVPEDVQKKYSFKALGTLTRNQKGLQPYARELEANIKYILGEQQSFTVLDMGNHAEMRKLELERLMNGGDTDLLVGNISSEDEFTWNLPEDQEKKTEKQNPTDEWQVTAYNENIMSEAECKKIREVGGVMLILPFGSDTGRKTQRIMTLLKNQDCKILGIIIGQADEEFLNRYYS